MVYAELANKDNNATLRDNRSGGQGFSQTLRARLPLTAICGAGAAESQRQAIDVRFPLEDVCYFGEAGTLRLMRATLRSAAMRA